MPHLSSDADIALKDKALGFLKRYATDGSDLSENREAALKAYRRDPYPEDAAIPDGSRSKFVTSDVADTIEWILPSLARIFYSGKDVVKIEGRGPEDDEGAELLNQKVNWDITRQNNGFLLFFDWFKASMLNKFSVVKYSWENKKLYKTEKFKEVSAQELDVLANDPDFEIKTAKQVESVEETTDPMGMPVQTPVTKFNVNGRRVRKKISRPVAEVVPPEEFICSLTCRDLKTEEFYAHGPIRIHKSDLMEKYDLTEQDLADQESALSSTTDSEVFQRFKDLGGITFLQAEDDKDFYKIYECYLYNEKREPIILTLLGDMAIEKQDNDGSAGFCMLSPIRMPHRAIGMSFYDLVGDIQKLRTSLTRFVNNNIYYQTDGMLVINQWKVNIADFVTQRRPGGVIRTKDSNVNPQDAIWPVPVQPIAGHVFGWLESTENMRENRTGVTRYNQGMQADSLNKTARGISEIMAASAQRIELIARIFAETGVRDLMIAFAEMNVKFLDAPTKIRLNQKWQNVDPKQIDVLFDATVDVALGTGSKEVNIQQMTQNIDRALNPNMIASGVIQPNNIYEMWKTLFTEMGYKNTDKYLTNPQVLMPPGGVVAGPNQGNAGLAPEGVPSGLAQGAAGQVAA